MVGKDKNDIKRKILFCRESTEVTGNITISTEDTPYIGLGLSGGKVNSGQITDSASNLPVVHICVQILQSRQTSEG